jgi:hypothetical protein
MSDSLTYEKCAEMAGLVFADVEACASSARGTALQLEMEKLSQRIIQESQHVPVILYNRIYNETEYSEALVNFAGITQEILNGAA